MDWHTNSMDLTIELDPTESKYSIRNLFGTDTAEMTFYSYNGSFTFFDISSF